MLPILNILFLILWSPLAYFNPTHKKIIALNGGLQAVIVVLYSFLLEMRYIKSIDSEQLMHLPDYFAMLLLQIAHWVLTLLAVLLLKSYRKSE